MRNWFHPPLEIYAPAQANRWQDIEFYCLDSSAVREGDVLVCLNPPQENVVVRVRGALLLLQEPPVIINRWFARAFEQFDLVAGPWRAEWGMPANFFAIHGGLPWNVGLTFDKLVGLPPPYSPSARLIWIGSKYATLPGHRWRLRLLKRLSEKGVPVEVYGRGFREVPCKFHVMYGATHVLAVENSFFPHYWTEKIADAYLCWAVPFYGGAPNILDYFPASSMVRIDPGEQTIKEICEVVHSELDISKWRRRIEAVAEARRKVLYEYNILEHMRRLATMLLERVGSSPIRERWIASVHPSLWQRAINRVFRYAGSLMKRVIYL